jgi:hypothetical protein
MEDLWPEDIGYRGKLAAPSIILKEQGELLGNKTGNIVVGEVRRRKPSTVEEANKLTYRFLISCPSLSYAYEFFSIMHEVVFYPLVLIVEDDDIRNELGFRAGVSKVKIKDEESFKKWLRRIFNTTKFKTVVSALLAQQ